MTKEPKLPRKPSALIRLALRDLRTVEADPRYRVVMSYWHEMARGQCVVCWAGAVMAGSLGANLERTAAPEDFGADEGALHALDALRTASAPEYLRQACDFIGATPIAWTEKVPAYELDPEGFHAALGRLAGAFEASGQ